MTVAHEQAQTGKWKTEDIKILTLQISWKDTVAHLQAQNGWTTKNKKILILQNTGTESVQDMITSYNIKNRPYKLNIEEIKNNIFKINIRYQILKGKTPEEKLRYFKKTTI